jgi:hypothetical protein
VQEQQRSLAVGGERVKGTAAQIQRDRFQGVIPI